MAAIYDRSKDPNAIALAKWAAEQAARTPRAQGVPTMRFDPMQITAEAPPEAPDPSVLGTPEVQPVVPEPELPREEAPSALAGLAGLGPGLANAQQRDRISDLGTGLGSQMTRAAALMRGEKNAPEAGAMPSKEAAYADQLRRSKLEEMKSLLEKSRATRENKLADITIRKGESELADAEGKRVANSKLDSPVTLFKQALVGKLTGKPAAGMTGAQIDQILPSAEKMWDAEQRSKDRQLARDVALAGKNEKAANKSNLGDMWELPQGREFPGGEAVKNKFLEASAGAVELSDAVGRLKETFNEVGNDLAGPKAQKLATQTVGMLFKIKDKYTLGQLSKSDIEMAETLAPNPTKFFTFLQAKLGVRDPRTAYDVLRSETLADMNAKARTYGVKPKAGGVFDTGGGEKGPAQPAKPEKRYDMGGGKVGIVKADGTSVVRFPDGHEEPYRG